MNLFGIGIDVVETVRMEQSLDRFGKSFVERIFTEGEIAYCEKSKFPARQYGARFAAKEAVSKAFGTGIGEHMGWKDLEVCRKDSGEPYIVLHGAAKDFAEANKVTQVKVSLTHTDNYTAANAIVIAE